MNLSNDEVIELNLLLKSTKLELPSFKREVTKHCGNYQWLQKNILKRNPNISDRLKQLLDIKPVKAQVPETEVEGG